MNTNIYTTKHDWHDGNISYHCYGINTLTYPGGVIFLSNFKIRRKIYYIDNFKSKLTWMNEIKNT